MSQLYLFDVLLKNLQGQLRRGTRGYMTKEQAYQQLRSHTGQDFGYDVNLWRSWIETHPESILASKRNNSN